jgi:hypothetical protein
MKIILDDFIIFNDLSIHLKKHNFFLLNAKSMALVWVQKNVHLWFFGTILGFIVSKKGKTHDPKKIEALIKMLIL